MYKQIMSLQKCLYQYLLGSLQKANLRLPIRNTFCLNIGWNGFCFIKLMELWNQRNVKLSDNCQVKLKLAGMKLITSHRFN